MKERIHEVYYPASMMTREQELLRQAHAALRQHSQQPRFSNPISERIANADWHALADRTQPLPSNISLQHLLEFFGKAFVIQELEPGTPWIREIH